MAFRATNIAADDAYTTIKRTGKNLRTTLVSEIARMAAGPTDFDQLKELVLFMVNVNAQINTLKTTPGLAAHAKLVENDPAYDAPTEFNVMLSAITSAMAWMQANMPTNITAKQPSQWSSQSSMIATTFSAAQTAGLRAELQAVVDTIS